jgi:5-methylcytosine-specific restriction endonuclease McrA
MNDSYWKRISKRHKLPYELIKTLYVNQEKKCFYCKVKMDGSNLHIDHYYPKDISKIVLSCPDCNRLKWQKTGDEFITFIATYISRFN